MSGVDFDVFLYAAAQLKHHQDIYQPPFIRAGLQYFYSPLFALCLLPFSSLPYYVPECAWLILSCFWLCRIWVLSCKYFDTSLLSNKNRKIWFFLSFFLILHFVLENFGQVQMTLFLLWATLESLRLFDNKKRIAGAALLALAINIKLMPLIFIPYLFYRKKIAEGILTIFFLMVFLFLPALFISYHYNNFLLLEWWKIINPSNAEHVIEARNGPNSLDAMIPVYITNTVGEMNFKRNFIDIPIKNIFLILNVVRLAFVLLSLFFFRSLPFKKADDTLREFWEISYLFIVTPLLFPHMQVYAFFYVFPLIIYLVYYILVQKQITHRTNYALLLFFGIACIDLSPLIGTDVIGRFLFHLVLHYRILTFSAVLLIIIALVCRPEKIMDSKKDAPKY
jgi:hypothetical protein